MNYLFYYIIIGLILSLTFDLLNEFVLRSEDRIKFNWGNRVINTIIWPYVLGVFLKKILVPDKK